jgi:hypothetical protein
MCLVPQPGKARAPLALEIPSWEEKKGEGSWKGYSLSISLHYWRAVSEMECIIIINQGRPRQRFYFTSGRPKENWTNRPPLNLLTSFLLQNKIHNWPLIFHSFFSWSAICFHDNCLIALEFLKLSYWSKKMSENAAHLLFLFLNFQKYY